MDLSTEYRVLNGTVTQHTPSDPYHDSSLFRFIDILGNRHASRNTIRPLCGSESPPRIRLGRRIGNGNCGIRRFYAQHRIQLRDFLTI